MSWPLSSHTSYQLPLCRHKQSQLSINMGWNSMFICWWHNYLTLDIKLLFLSLNEVFWLSSTLMLYSCFQCVFLIHWVTDIIIIIFIFYFNSCFFTSFYNINEMITQLTCPEQIKNNTLFFFNVNFTYSCFSVTVCGTFRTSYRVTCILVSESRFLMDWITSTLPKYFTHTEHKTNI